MDVKLLPHQCQLLRLHSSQSGVLSQSMSVITSVEIIRSPNNGKEYILMCKKDIPYRSTNLYRQPNDFRSDVNLRREIPGLVAFLSAATIY